MIADEKKIINCKILSIRYKILKSNFQELRSLMYTLVKIKSAKHYKLLIIHKKGLKYIILVEIKKNIRIVDYIY